MWEGTEPIILRYSTQTASCNGAWIHSPINTLEFVGPPNNICNWLRHSLILLPTPPMTNNSVPVGIIANCNWLILSKCLCGQILLVFDYSNVVTIGHNEMWHILDVNSLFVFSKMLCPRATTNYDVLWP